MDDIELADALSAKGEHELAAQVLRRAVERKTTTTQSPESTEQVDRVAAILAPEALHRTGRGESYIPFGKLIDLSDDEIARIKQEQPDVYRQSLEQLGAPVGVVS